MRSFLSICTLAIATCLFAQPNCEVFKANGDSLKYLACKKSEEIDPYYQFSKEFHEILDQALAIDSTFDYPYYAKSIAYLKSGDFLNWKKLIDKAVQYNLTSNLGYRGWCRYQFFRDYQGAIDDFELLEQVVGNDTGYSANGDYHLQIARALCYRALGNHEKALQVMTNFMNQEGYYAGIYDYLHLGVLYMEMNRYDDALDALLKQESENPLADNQYYLALTYQALNQKTEYISMLQRAKESYEAERKIFDYYTHPFDKVYLSDIEKALEEAIQETH